MNRTFFKAVFADIKKTKGRFFSIIAIIMLGVGFLVGIMAATPSLKNSYSNNYIKYEAFDLNYKYGGGLDIDKVKTTLGDEYDIYYGKVNDQQIVTEENLSHLSRIYNFTPDYISNTTELLSGRYPTSENECVVVTPTKRMVDFELGTKLSSIDSVDLLGTAISFNDVEVVGIVKSPLYVSKDNEISYVSANPLETVVFLPAINQTMITDIMITFDDLREEFRFDKKYFEKVQKYDDIIKPKYSTIVNDRYTEISNTLDYLVTNNQITEIQKETILNQIGSSITSLNLKSNYSYNYFEANAAKIDNVVSVFPPFFFFVAALVALSSVTRLVEEDRMIIGTYKALGYTKSQIAFRYVAYGGISSIVGALLGVSCGIFALPLIIFNAFSTNFLLPSFFLSFNMVGTVISFFLAIIMTITVSLLAVISSLRSSPAQLMVPKVPKSGSRILLERIPFIWNRLKFKGKSTFRNLFRYKKQLVMTIIGILGSTTLLFTGFAIRDSFDALSNVTYNELRLYQFTIDGDVKNEELELYFETDDKSYFPVISKMVEFNNGSVSIPTEVVVIPLESQEEFKNFINVRTEKGQEPIAFDTSSIIISSQIGQKMNYSSHSKGTLIYSGQNIDIQITGICENYLDNYVFMSEESYEATFHEELTYNKAFVRCNPSLTDSIIDEVSAINGVTSLTNEASNKESYQSLISSINMIDYVLIACSLALAVIIIYNISTVTISERKRELATLKVLGVSNVNTAGYVLRVILILSVVGILLGLVGGLILTHFVIIQTESIGIRFGRNFSWVSYVLTMFLMLLFIGIIDIFMLPSIRKINPSESLKSVE